MVVTSLPDLVIELTIHMDKSMGSMGNASSLSGTSIQLHEMFKKNIPSICNGVLPHAVTGCSQARDFFHAQQEIATTSLPILNDPTQATIKRVVEFLLEARSAKRALGLYEKEVLADHGYNSIERTQFTQAVYRALT